jgi:predicted acyltransferase
MELETEKTPKPLSFRPETPGKPERFVSLDAYRGFLMLLLTTSAFQLHKVAQQYKVGPVWRFVTYQFSHGDWRSCTLWDLIQPSFMFMVGVAVPYSIASRRSKGATDVQVFGHALWRSLLLVLLGVFIMSSGSKVRETNWTFVNVLSQIGLGYAFLVLLHGRGLRVQFASLAAILVGYWLCFALYPVPGEGFERHWNLKDNFGARFDHWFLNLFPPHAFAGNDYSTLNFIPSTATMLIGVMAGEMLRGPRLPMEKFKRLLAAGVACFAISVPCDPQILPYVSRGWVICPIVKKIWTPSWALFCSGWTLWILAAFYWIIDVRGWKRWTSPLVVVGMNCTAMYCMWMMFKGWVLEAIQKHLGHRLFDTAYGPIWASLAWTSALWLICFWMYRRKIFLKI